MGYVAKSPLVIVRDTTGRDVFVYTDSPIPENVLPATLAMLLSEGHITETGGPSEVELDADVTDGPVRPNEAGPGSAKDKWVEYADAVGVWVDADASKDDIIAAVKSAGL